MGLASPVPSEAQVGISEWKLLPRRAGLKGCLLPSGPAGNGFPLAYLGKVVSGCSARRSWRASKGVPEDLRRISKAQLRVLSCQVWTRTAAVGFSLLLCLFSSFWISSCSPAIPKKEMPLHQVSDKRTGKGIFLQRVHKQGEKTPLVQDAQPHRSPSENMVPKSKDEREETESRSTAVFYGESLVLRDLRGRRAMKGPPECTTPTLWAQPAPFPSFSFHAQKLWFFKTVHVYRRGRGSAEMNPPELGKLGKCNHPF